MIAALTRAGKVAAGVASAALVAGLGLPALGALLFLAVLVIGAACWVLRSDARTERVSRVLLAWRGNANSPGRRRHRRACAARAAAAPLALALVSRTQRVKPLLHIGNYGLADPGTPGS